MRVVVALALIFALFTLPATTAQVPASRMIIISWDGAADWVIDSLLEQGRLPNLARMVESGVRAEFVTPAFPSVTAASHAAIWTGAYGNINGVSANVVPMMPRSLHTLMEQRDGFESGALIAEPIWMTAMAAGKRVTALSATHQAPADPYLNALLTAGIPADRFNGFDAFRSQITPARIFTEVHLRPASTWSGLEIAGGRSREASISIGERQFHFVAFDSPDDSVDGFDTVRICPDQKSANLPECVNLKPVDATPDVSQWSRAFRVTQADLFGMTSFRLFTLTPDASQILLYQDPAYGYQTSASRAVLENYVAAAGGFAEPPFGLYQQGRFGAVLWAGGDGAAERRLLEIIRFEIEFLKRGTRFALSQLQPDLLIHYTSASDGAGHAWMGVLDPASPIYNAAVAARLWPFYAEVLQLQDAWLGTILDQAGSDTIVSLVSDHGMVGVGKTFFPNAVLERAGLLSRSTGGTIDPGRTKIAAVYGGGLFINVNSTDWKDGIVPLDHRDDVIRQAAEALLAARDPQNGAQIVSRVFRPEESQELGIGGPAGGDLYLDLAEGYTSSGAISSTVAQQLISPIGAGVHGFYPLRPKLQAIWYATGPGLARGKLIRGVRQIDIAPTLSKLMGIPVPRNATGAVVDDALATGSDN